MNVWEVLTKNSRLRYLIYPKRLITISLALLTTIMLFQRCRNYYGAGMAGKDFLAQSKPHHLNKDCVKTYASAQVHYGGHFNEDEENIGFDFSTYRSHSKKWAAYSYGAYGFFGEYSAVPFYNYAPEIRSYYGLGINGEAFLNLPLESFDWRIAGIKASFSQEFGPFNRFRERVAQIEESGMADYDNVAITGRTFSWALASEGVLKITNHSSIGCGTFWGLTNFVPDGADVVGGFYLYTTFKNADIHLNANTGGFHHKPSLNASIHFPFSFFKE